MSKNKFVLSAMLVATGVGMALPSGPVQAQGRRAVDPERQLLGVRLGRPFLEVIRKFGTPSEIQTVALAAPTDVIPDLGGEGGGGMPAMGGMPSLGGMPSMGGMSGGGNRPFGGGSPFGGAPMGSPGMGGIPVLPPSGGNGPGGGMGMMPGGGGNGPGGAMSAPGGEGGLGGGQQLPEYSNAILWIYHRPNNVRYEFLINEDGRVAQISVAAPSNKPVPGSQTARGIALNSDFGKVMEQYGNPERHRMLPGFRFYEAYYSKNYHAAFTFDTGHNMKVVRITIALAD